MDLFRKKPLAIPQNAGAEKLSKTLGALDLTMLGVGAIIGTGIFVMTGVAAAEHAGPGLVLSFIIAGIACVLSALCYSNLLRPCRYPAVLMPTAMWPSANCWPGYSAGILSWNTGLLPQR